MALGGPGDRRCSPRSTGSGVALDGAQRALVEQQSEADASLATLAARVAEGEAEADQAREALDAVRASRSFRVAAGLRRIAHPFSSGRTDGPDQMGRQR